MEELCKSFFLKFPSKPTMGEWAEALRLKAAVARVVEGGVCHAAANTAAGPADTIPMFQDGACGPSSEGRPCLCGQENLHEEGFPDHTSSR